MNKTNKKSINFGLIIIAIFTFSTVVLSPGIVKANDDVFVPVQPYTRPIITIQPVSNPVPFVTSISPDSVNLGGGAKNITITGSNFVPNSIARLNGSNRPTTFIDYSHLLINLSAGDMIGSSGNYITVFNPAPNGGYSNAIFLTINGYVDPSTATINSNTTDNTSYPNSTNTNVNPNNTSDNSTSTLASNAIYGTGIGFLPSGIIQWLFVIIFILLVVMLIRKIYLTHNEDTTPLKHA